MRILILPAAALLLAGCASTPESEPESESSGVSVVATTTVWGNVTEQITACGGGQVTTLMPIGADPHDYSPSAQDVATMVNSDLVIANGLGLEEGLESAIESAQADGATVLTLAPDLDPLPFGGGDHDHGGEDHDHEGDDPHVWLDPVRVATAAEIIGTQLSQVTGEAQYTECGTRVAEDIRATDAEVAEILMAVPDDRRILVTDHDALGYFADRYGFEIAGVVVPGGSTLGDPSSSEVADLVGTIKAAGVPAIFANTANPQGLIDALASEVGDVSVVELYIGSIGEPGSGAESYQTMMLSNASAIAGSLG